MIKSLQVQDTVDGHVRPVRRQRLVLVTRLECDDRRADHQFPQEKSAVGSKTRPCKGKHIRRLVLMPIARIQTAAAREAYLNRGGKPVEEGFQYSSDTNPERLDARGLQELLVHAFV